MGVKYIIVSLRCNLIFDSVFLRSGWIFDSVNIAKRVQILQGNKQMPLPHSTVHAYTACQQTRTIVIQHGARAWQVPLHTAWYTRILQGRIQVPLPHSTTHAHTGFWIFFLNSQYVLGALILKFYVPSFYSSKHKKLSKSLKHYPNRFKSQLILIQTENWKLCVYITLKIYEKKLLECIINLNTHDQPAQ